MLDFEGYISKKMNGSEKKNVYLTVDNYIEWNGKKRSFT